MTDELKACPFCGDKAVKLYKSYVKCNNRMCPAYYFVTWMPEKTWNTRPVEDALHARIAELEEQLEEREVIAANIGFLTSQRELEVADLWIPVSERLPEEDVPYLTIVKGNDIPVVAKYNDHDKGFTDCRVGRYVNVTHWMPLPESPNDTQKDTVVYGKERER